MAFSAATTPNSDMPNRPDSPDGLNKAVNLLIVSGRSGSGKTSVLNILEDFGYYAIDNMPLSLLADVAAKLIDDSQITKVALGVDVRTPHADLSKFADIRSALIAKYGRDQVKVLYVTAQEPVLVARFAATRRVHPLMAMANTAIEPTDRITAGANSDINDPATDATNDNISADINSITNPKSRDTANGQTSAAPSISQSLNLPAAIQKEIELLHPIACHADMKIDTSQLNIHQLKASVREHIGLDNQVTVNILSFGFKYGIPIDADFVFDVRILPNPHWQPSLRAKTGNDDEVAQFFAQYPEVAQMQQDIFHFLQQWLPHFLNNNRHTLTVAIGCTGGKHRSVFISNNLCAQLQASLPQGLKVSAKHREKSRWQA